MLGAGGQALRAWEPQPGEVTPRNHGKPWAAFKVFRDLGPGRTLKAAAATYYQHPSNTLPEHLYNQVKKWASKFDWHERVQSFDDHYTMRERLAIEEWRNRQAEDLGRREAALRERSLVAREKALEQSIKMLEFPLLEQRVLHESEDGTPQTLVFVPARWSKSTVPGLFQMAVGDQWQPPEDDDLEDWDLSSWSDQDLRSYLQLMEKVRPAKSPGRPG